MHEATKGRFARVQGIGADRMAVTGEIALERVTSNIGA